MTLLNLKHKLVSIKTGIGYQIVINLFIFTILLGSIVLLLKK